MHVQIPTYAFNVGKFWTFMLWHWPRDSCLPMASTLPLWHSTQALIVAHAVPDRRGTGLGCNTLWGRKPFTWVSLGFEAVHGNKKVEHGSHNGWRRLWRWELFCGGLCCGALCPAFVLIYSSAKTTRRKQQKTQDTTAGHGTAQQQHSNSTKTAQ